MTPEVNQSLEDYIKSLGRTSTDKYKQDLLTTFNAEVDKNISNGYVGGLVGSTKEYNKEKHAVLVAIALSKGYTVGTPVVGNGVYTATLTKSTATPATPATPSDTVSIDKLEATVKSFVKVRDITSEEYKQDTATVYEKQWFKVKTAYNNTVRRLVELVSKGVTTVEDVAALTDILNKLYEFAAQTIDLNSDRAAS
jgi:hypothetical protein